MNVACCSFCFSSRRPNNPSRIRDLRFYVINLPIIIYYTELTINKHPKGYHEGGTMRCTKCWNECVNIGELVRGQCDACTDKDAAKEDEK